jgi:glycosyltransferase involved in cell wall biosynthesis
MNKNLVSVVVPVYNVAPYLERCLSSLVSQTYKDMEILLIDDGSTDVSSNICDDYAQYYKNIVVVHQSNSGVSAARNKALDIAKGEYIYFVDPDDWCEPDTIEKLHKCLQKTNADFASCSMYTNKSVERQIPPPN